MNQPGRQSVWLPAPLYEAVPYVYLGVGFALLAGLGYVGLDGAMSAVYALSGILSLVSGGLVLYHRRAVRRPESGGR